MIEERDFTGRRYFPGTHGNTFDVILRAAALVQSIPGWLFALLLLGLAVIPSRLDAWRALALWGFLLLDWALVAFLPRAGRSFGPAQPPVLMLALLRLPFAFLPALPAFALQLSGTLLVVYSFWIEPHRIHVTRQALQTGKLPPGASLTVLHLGDMHVERITSRERQLNALIGELKPDLILFSGDFLNLSYLDDPQAQQAAREILAGWHAPLGVLGVTGSPAVDHPDTVQSLIQGSALCLLNNQRATIRLPVTGDASGPGPAIDVLGLSCSHKPFEDGPVLQSLLPEPPERFTLLLYHSPDLAPIAARLGADLQLSGHTHGGQVRLPLIGALTTASLYGRKLAQGRVPVNGMTLYTTRGIGMEGAGAPRVRFLCPPEVIFWTISGKTGG